jgi:hypothetical protein
MLKDSRATLRVQRKLGVFFESGVSILTRVRLLFNLAGITPPRKGQGGPTGAYLSERLISVVLKTGLVFPIPAERTLSSR